MELTISPRLRKQNVWRMGHPAIENKVCGVCAAPLPKTKNRKMTKSRNITICACSSRTLLPKLKVAQVVASLRETGHNVTLVSDMCEMALQQPEHLRELAQDMVMGCHERAVGALLKSLGVHPSTIVDLRSGSVVDAIGRLQSPAADDVKVDEVLREIDTFEVKQGHDAWYPVIDRQRCINCGKCHDFCLFGVYSIQEGVVQVTQPTACKNNCPACARVCPVGAVIFAKCDEAPINGGEAAVGEGVTFKVDMNAVYSEALRERLQHRRASVLLRKESK